MASKDLERGENDEKSGEVREVGKTRRILPQNDKEEKTTQRTM